MKREEGSRGLGVHGTEITKYDIWYDIYLSTAIGLTPGGSSTVHIYTQYVDTTQITEQHK